MADFLGQNLSTIIVGGLLAICVFLAVGGVVGARKRGKTSCGGDCSRCGMYAVCKKDIKK